MNEILNSFKSSSQKLGLLKIHELNLASVPLD